MYWFVGEKRTRSEEIRVMKRGYGCYPTWFPDDFDIFGFHMRFVHSMRDRLRENGFLFLYRP